MSDSFCEVRVASRTRSLDQRSAIGFVVSMTVLPLRLAMPSHSQRGLGRCPLGRHDDNLTELAASSNEPIFSFPFGLDFSSSRLLAVFVPIVTWWPVLDEAVGEHYPTVPDPSSPTLVIMKDSRGRVEAVIVPEIVPAAPPRNGGAAQAPRACPHGSLERRALR